LKELSKEQITLLVNVDTRFTRLDPKIASFWGKLVAKHAEMGLQGTKHCLSPEERHMVEKFKVESRSSAPSTVNVFDRLLAAENTKICVDGISVGNSSLMKTIQPVFPDEIDRKPGAQLIVGAIIATHQRAEVGVKETDLTVLKQISVPEISVAQVADFQREVKEDIMDMTKVKSKGPGREYMAELMENVKDMPKSAFIMLHVAAMERLFPNCFEWEWQLKRKGKWAKVEDRTLGSIKVAVAVKKKYESSFFEYPVNGEGMREVRKVRPAGKIFLWVRALPGLKDVSTKVEASFHAVTDYLSKSRGFRGTDEAGLSAWSGGFGAISGMTKKQRSVARKLSIILGAASKHSMVIVEDSSVEHRTMAIQNLVRRNVANVKYRVERTELSKVTDHVEWYVIDDYMLTSDTALVVFDDSSITVAKKTEWRKVDSSQKAKKDFFFSKAIGTVIVCTHVYSAAWFTDLHVSWVTSIHNMYAVVSNRAIVAAASEQLEGDLSYKVLPSLTEKQYLTAVISHNTVRNLYFLYPSYQFNSKMNLLLKTKIDKLQYQELEFEEGLPLDKEYGEVVMENPKKEKKKGKSKAKEEESYDSDAYESAQDDSDSSEEEEKLFKKVKVKAKKRQAKAEEKYQESDSGEEDDDDKGGDAPEIPMEQYDFN